MLKGRWGVGEGGGEGGGGWFGRASWAGKWHEPCCVREVCCPSGGRGGVGSEKKPVLILGSRRSLNLPRSAVWFCVAGVTLGGEVVSRSHPLRRLNFSGALHLQSHCLRRLCLERPLLLHVALYWTTRLFMDTALADIVGGQASSDASMMPWGREAEGFPLAFGGR